MSALKSSSNNSLVEKILEQGQRLRNSMVQTVLNYDPFNTEILNSYNSPRRNIEDEQIDYSDHKKLHSSSDVLRVERYLNGEDMCINEETQALETLRSMSPNSLIRSTSCAKTKGYHDDNCDICCEYNAKVVKSLVSVANSEKYLSDLKPDENKHYNTPAESSRANKGQIQNITSVIPQDINEISQKSSSVKLKAVKKTFHENKQLLRFVDSLKINIYSLKLNKAGNTKIMATDNINKPFLTSTNTYFVEYTLPEILIRNVPKSRAKVNTGLNPDRTVRFCSKKLQNGAVYFKQHSVHQVSNINLVDLSTIKIEFRVSYRSVKQRTSLLIGIAKFNLGYLSTSEFFTGEQELVLKLQDSPISIGSLKVSLQFGCDKLYFGKEFIEALTCSKENTNLSESDSMYNENKQLKTKDESNLEKILVANDQNVIETISSNPEPVLINEIEKPVVKSVDTLLLYALIYITEVRLLSDPINTYIVSRGFSRDDSIKSKTVYNDFKPIFNLYQIIPVLLNGEFINRLRDNYIIVEVWEIKDNAPEKLIGLSKLSTHQLYVAYRNPDIVKHLFKNPNPVLGVDWWEPVTCPVSSSETGQLRALIAVGSSSQIENLEQNRNIRKEKKSVVETPKLETLQSDSQKISSLVHFDLPEKIDQVKSHKDTNYFINRSLKRIPSNRFNSNYFPQYSGRIEKDIDEKNNISFYDRRYLSKNNESVRKTILVSDKYVQEPEIELTPSTVSVDKVEIITCSKIDASTQSEITEMDKSVQKDFLNSFLEQLLTARDLNHKNNYVENSTNTDNLTSEIASPIVDNKSSNMNKSRDKSLKNTSELLDSLQKVLTEKKTINADSEKEICDSFKAHIVIENALHLPSRKKCKSKKYKTKSPKNNEEILPSTYVTFKGMSESDYLVTKVVAKSTSPRWDYRCDILLPADLLLNNQKRLIFKVWRKSNNHSLQPNFQTDIVLGFAALDLTVLLSGLPNVQGWFNIVDFSSKCNGQIKINITPLENLSKFTEFKRTCVPEKLRADKAPPQEILEDSVPSELLSRALKRKFSELDEITQRLRQRLSAVTYDDSDLSNDEFADEFERDLNTVCLDRDLNTVCLDREPNTVCLDREPNTVCLGRQPNTVCLDREPNTVCLDREPNTVCLDREPNTVCLDREPLNFSEKTVNSAEISTNVEPLINFNSEESSTSEINEENLTKLDTHLSEGKLKIDSLLEKLTLLTSENDNQNNKSDRSFSSRYVSGCSINHEPEKQVLKDLGIENSPDLIFNPQLFQQMFTASLDSTPSLEFMSSVHCTTLKNLVEDSTSSGSCKDLQSISSTSLSEDNITRQAPDGAGNVNN